MTRTLTGREAMALAAGLALDAAESGAMGATAAVLSGLDTDELRRYAVAATRLVAAMIEAEGETYTEGAELPPSVSVVRLFSQAAHP